MSSITPTKISHHFIVLEKDICVKYHHSKDITSLCCIIKTYVKYHSCKDITSLCCTVKIHMPNTYYKKILSNMYYKKTCKILPLQRYHIPILYPEKTYAKYVL